MKKLFIHHPLFRLLSPFFSGVIVYLLILLINNNVESLQEHFLGNELYLCIGLSYVIQELSRGLLILFEKTYNITSSFYITITKVVISMILCVVIVTIAITLYYKYFLGFSPNNEELWMFNSIFCSITLIYILLYISHQYLYKINTEKLKTELLLKESIENDFMQFKKGVNPQLLFESLESLIALIHHDIEKSDDFIDHLATIYRYILSSKSQQLVSINEELQALEELGKLFNYLPYRNISIKSNITSDFLIVPGSLLHITEQIIRSTIVSSGIQLDIKLTEVDDYLLLQYPPNDKITNGFVKNSLIDIENVYSIYSPQKLTITDNIQNRTIHIPKLITKA